jgi:hypothetical protein
MTKGLNTFYNYLYSNNTDNVNKFITYISHDAIDKLPNYVCSSKVLYEILRNDLDTYFKQKIFRETFMEYYKWKLLYSENHELQYLV